MPAAGAGDGPMGAVVIGQGETTRKTTCSVSLQLLSVYICVCMQVRETIVTKGKGGGGVDDKQARFRKTTIT